MASGFLFNTTRSILCEVGAASTKVADVFTSLGCRSSQSLLLITDSGLDAIKLHRGCIEGLTRKGFDVHIFRDVVEDPVEANIYEAVEMARQKNAAGIIGFGGGSSMDVAKMVAFLSHKDCNQKLTDIYGVNMCIGARLPLVQIPTTAGTGSEVTPISIVTTGEKEKKGVVSSQLLPDCAVLDGELTISLPPHITAATGIDAMVHAIEAYTSRQKKNPLSDALARDALRLLGRNIRPACSRLGSHDARVRGDMLLGSLMAGMAFANAPVGAVHALAYPIGSLFKLPHGLSNSLMLPHVLRFNSQPVKGCQQTRQCAVYYSELGPLAFRDMYNGTTSASPYDAATLFANAFEELSHNLGLPQHLRDVGITPGDVEALTDDAMKQTRLLPHNAREVTRADVHRMYEAAL